MLKNSRQYVIAKRQLKSLKETLELSKSNSVEMDPRLFRAMIAGIESQIEDIQTEITEYENLEKAKHFSCGMLNDIGQLLVKARIARGYSQKELAGKIGLTQQQIQKYEANDYKSAKLERLEEIMQALGYSAIVELAMSADKLACYNAPSPWNMPEPELEMESPPVSRGSEWSIGDTDRQWKFEREAA